jgi:hypothetical protein
MFPPVLGERSYFGAEEAVDMRPFSDTINDPECDYEIFTVQGFSQKEIDSVLVEMYNTYAGSTYGFPKLFWFVYRWFMEGVFHKDVRREHNWFPWHQICSEIGWWWFEKLCLLQPQRMAPVHSKLHEWNSNTFDTVDPLTVMQQFPEIFVRTESKINGVFSGIS